MWFSEVEKVIKLKLSERRGMGSCSSVDSVAVNIQTEDLNTAKTDSNRRQLKKSDSSRSMSEIKPTFSGEGLSQAQSLREVAAPQLTIKGGRSVPSPKNLRKSRNKGQISAFSVLDSQLYQLTADEERVSREIDQRILKQQETTRTRESHIQISRKENSPPPSPNDSDFQPYQGYDKSANRKQDISAVLSNNYDQVNDMQHSKYKVSHYSSQRAVWPQLAPIRTLPFRARRVNSSKEASPSKQLRPPNIDVRDAVEYIDQLVLQK